MNDADKIKCSREVVVANGYAGQSERDMVSVVGYVGLQGEMDDTVTSEGACSLDGVSLCAGLS